MKASTIAMWIMAGTGSCFAADDISVATNGKYSIVLDRTKMQCESDSGICHDPGLCEALVANLNAAQVQGPMVCERQYSVDFGFSTPDWVAVPADEINWELIKERFYEASQFSHGQGEKMEKFWQENLASMKGLLQRGDTILWKADVNFGNGVVKKALMLRDSQCTAEKRAKIIQSDPTIFFLDSSEMHLDAESVNYNHITNELFYYSDNLYTARWMGGWGYPEAELSILTAGLQTAAEFLGCEISYDQGER